MVPQVWSAIRQPLSSSPGQLMQSKRDKGAAKKFCRKLPKGLRYLMQIIESQKAEVAKHKHLSINLVVLYKRWEGVGENQST